MREPPDPMKPAEPIAPRDHRMDAPLPLTYQSITPQIDFLSEYSESAALRYHNHTGHPSLDTIRKTKLFKLSATDIKLINSCPTCAYIKIKKKNRNHKDKPEVRTQRPLQVVHLDITGAFKDDNNTKWYTIIIVDDYTRYTKTVTVTKKAMVADEIKKVLTEWSLLLDSPVGCLKLDNGDEFNKLSEDYRFAEHPDYTPEHNAIAERQVGLIKQITTTILHPFKDNKYVVDMLYPYAARYAAELRNRWYHSTIDGIPAYRFHGKLPQEHTSLPYFGSDVWVMYKKKKIPAVYIGYNSEFSTYHCLTLSHPCEEIVVNSLSESYTFHGVYFLLNILISLSSLTTYMRLLPFQRELAPVSKRTTPGPLLGVRSGTKLPSQALPGIVCVVNPIKIMPTYSCSSTTSPQLKDIALPVMSTSFRLHQYNTPILPTTESNQDKSSVSIVNIGAATAESTSPSLSKIHSSTPPPLYAAPKSYKQAIKSVSFTKAIDTEISQFLKHKVFTSISANEYQKLKVLVGFQVLHGIWLFSIKYDEYLSEHLSKARLVVLGNQERNPNVATASPSLTPYCFRIITKLAVNNGWEIRSADIKTVFLNSEVNRLIYLGVPEGFENIFPGAKVLKANKTIYGAVDSPLRFFFLQFIRRYSNLSVQILTLN
ncbi:unnamed protein product [Ambrosiozyma monospora]|uniref:Unnamed protein product n=1 Tax=Ambrosiozyma monospora TaxID=43982 RepID=A0A9W7DJY4_AMBMO|nr:unnamed protein product [Ambrosiozyma monospora]